MTFKTCLLKLTALLLIIAPDPSGAGMCDLDEDPAATLLLPYFEVDLDDPSAGNTIFTINNALAEPALAHVTLWTDWSHPTIDFHVFLTGYDIQQVNLADVFLNGNLPVTADLQSDPGDFVSPDGGFRSDGGFTTPSMPEWDGSFPNCDEHFPFYDNPVVVGAFMERLVNGHTGQPVAQTGGGCLGATFGDNVARGFITIDRVNRCDLVFPSEEDEGYFEADGTGIASNVNQLWGDWIFLDRQNGFAEGDALVHIEALDGFDALGDGTSEPMVPDPETGYTFYGRYTENGEDNREPLGMVWGTRYLNNAIFAPGGTELTVWRDPAIGRPDELGYVCGSPIEPGAGPVGFPMDEAKVLAFDEFENAVDLCPRFTCFGSSTEKCTPPIDFNPLCFPLATQKISSQNLGYDDVAPPWGAGWLYLDLRFRETEERAFGRLSQSHVSSTHSAQGLISVGLPAVVLGSACQTFDDSVTPDV